MKAITSKDDLQEARSAPRALVFLWVNWAVRARQSEAAMNKLLESWQRTFPQHPISVYRADLSDQEGEVWDAIRAWLETEGRPVDPLTFGGYGALLWMIAGKIAMHSAFLAQLEAPKLTLGNAKRLRGQRADPPALEALTKPRFRPVFSSFWRFC